MTKLRNIAFIFAVIAASAPAATDPRSYETEWHVTEEIPADFLKERLLNEQSYAFKQGILFAKIGKSDVAVIAAENGESFVPAGEQFYKALTQGPELWCTANMKMPEGEFMKSVVGRVYSQYCILDSDKDGVFDGFFKRARTIEALPTVRGKITPNPRPIKPLRLEAVEPASLRTSYFVGINYIKLIGKAGNKRPLFQRFAVSEFGHFPMEERFAGSAGINQSINVDGAKISYSVQSDGIKITSVEPFPAGPLKIIGTNCGMINGC